MDTETQERPSDVVDIASLSSPSEILTIDPTANAFARSTPLRDSRYRAVVQMPTNAEDMKNMIHRREIKSGDNKGKFFFAVDFEVKVMEYFDPRMNSQELLGKQRTFEKTISTMVRHVDGKQACEIATLLLAIGVAITGQVSQEELVKGLLEVLARKPQVGVITEVSARYDSGETEKWADGKDHAIWKTAYRGEKSFPKNPDGTTSYEVPSINTKKGPVVPFVKADVIDYFRL